MNMRSCTKSNKGKLNTIIYRPKLVLGIIA